MVSFPDMNWKLALGIVVLVVIGAGTYWWVTTHPAGVTKRTQITRSSEGTTIPPTAVQLDDFAFTDVSGVYLRGIVGTSSMKIPDADPETFKRVGDFIEWGNAEILEHCKGPGQYGIYTDKKKVYLFQAWETPTFAKTKIEVLKPLDPDTFVATGPQTFKDALHSSLSLGYSFATTSCEYMMLGIDQ